MNLISNLYFYFLVLENCIKVFISLEFIVINLEFIIINLEFIVINLEFIVINLEFIVINSDNTNNMILL